VDRVAAEAAVAPTTLYRLFASKDDLIGAYMQRAVLLYREWFDAAALTGGPHPRDQIASASSPARWRVRSRSLTRRRSQTTWS
jgi:AcrR family transcriptional regulator